MHAVLRIAKRPYTDRHALLRAVQAMHTVRHAQNQSTVLIASSDGNMHIAIFFISSSGAILSGTMMHESPAPYALRIPFG